ncbi:MAG TPA: hypothetical protein PLS77_14080 [Anaerolineaceae bacterium]|nr:hypothetical protein [Anaerolineaceae bacterium]HQF46936.1 hypothetical protein [Anaerolineaceae bacterium]HQH36824.1 hypothetical protein [Anaerolineaceae bacterium]
MYFHLPPRRTTAAIHRTTTTIGLDAYAKYVSIQVDDQDDPVIAFNAGNGMYFNMGIIYGNPDGSYDYQRVDGGHGINTGLDPALALDKYGRGFLVYMEDEEYSPNIRIAYQKSYTYLPSIMR